MEVKKKSNKAIDTLFRCLSLRCPACGMASIFQSPFRMRHHCPSCRTLFMREDGFFVGALMVNVVAAELAGMVFFFVCLMTLGYSDRLFYVTPFLALIFPAGFYHHSWSIWLCFDYLIESLPQYRET